jgi:HlyD family secretion protein
VRVRVFTAAKPDALLIPRSALFRAADGGWQVFTAASGKARLVGVEVGLMNDDVVEIAAGLGPDDLVILAPESSLVDGSRVRPITRE